MLVYYYFVPSFSYSCLSSGFIIFHTSKRHFRYLRTLWEVYFPAVQQIVSLKCARSHFLKPAITGEYNLFKLVALESMLAYLLHACWKRYFLKFAV